MCWEINQIILFYLFSKLNHFLSGNIFSELYYIREKYIQNRFLCLRVDVTLFRTEFHLLNLLNEKISLELSSSDYLLCEKKKIFRTVFSSLFLVKIIFGNAFSYLFCENIFLGLNYLIYLVRIYLLQKYLFTFSLYTMFSENIFIIFLVKNIVETVFSNILCLFRTELHNLLSEKISPALYSIIWSMRNILRAEIFCIILVRISFQNCIL